MYNKNKLVLNNDEWELCKQILKRQKLATIVLEQNNVKWPFKWKEVSTNAAWELQCTSVSTFSMVILCQGLYNKEVSFNL